MMANRSVATVFAKNSASWLLPGIALGIVALIEYVQPLFLAPTNVANILQQSSFLIIFALAQMLTILTRGLDLSQGGVVAISGVTFALTASVMGTPLGLLAGIAVGTLAGAANGYIVSRLNVSPFVVTLGVGSIGQGIALVASNGQPVYQVPANFASIGNGYVGGIAIPVIAASVIFAVLWVVLNWTVFGRWIYAVGSNPRASQLAGIATPRILFAAYALSGCLTSLGACLLASRISTGSPTVGADTALQAVAASVVGGVSLAGGRGTAVGVLAGAIFLGMLANALNLLNVSSYLQTIAVGVAIILAVAVDHLRQRISGAAAS
jgi:ribose/xylose/arabinose/galactoside ABC-type transport system permease subunit